MDEVSLDKMGFTCFSKLITSSKADPSSTTDTSYADLALVNSIILSILTNMTDSLNEVHLTLGSLYLWTKSIINIKNKALKVEGDKTHLYI